MPETYEFVLNLINFIIELRKVGTFILYSVNIIYIRK